MTKRSCRAVAYLNHLLQGRAGAVIMLSTTARRAPLNRNVMPLRRGAADSRVTYCEGTLV